MDPVIHVSERHQSDMLQGQSGYAREKHAEELASVNNERDFDKVADAPVIHMFIFGKVGSVRKTNAIADRSEWFTHRAAPPQRRTKCRL